MALRPINIRHKGQITLPADIREELGLKEGDRLILERRGREIVLISPDDVVDPTAGAFRDYAKGKHLTPEQIREVAEQSTANQVMSELEDIERDRLHHVH
jgi:AbrB family looped-hinge helix DNA binding protein